MKFWENAYMIALGKQPKGLGAAAVCILPPPPKKKITNATSNSYHFAICIVTSAVAHKFSPPVPEKMRLATFLDCVLQTTRLLRALVPYLIRNWSHTATHLVLLIGRYLQNSLSLRRFKSDRDEIWQDGSSSKYASIGGVKFSIWRHSFKKAAMASFHAEKCCSLVSAEKRVSGAYAAAPASSWSIVHWYLFLSDEWGRWR